MEVWHWLTTAPSGRSHTHGADDGQTGWRLHAVFVDDRATFNDIRYARAACGMLPGTGWGLDLFIEQRCASCVRKLQKLGATEALRRNS